MASIADIITGLRVFERQLGGTKRAVWAREDRIGVYQLMAHENDVLGDDARVLERAGWYFDEKRQEWTVDT